MEDIKNIKNGKVVNYIQKINKLEIEGKKIMLKKFSKYYINKPN